MKIMSNFMVFSVETLQAMGTSVWETLALKFGFLHSPSCATDLPKNPVQITHLLWRFSFAFAKQEQ